MRLPRRPVLLPPGPPYGFPDPHETDDDGLLAIGGDLSVERLVQAYSNGIFPWYDEGLPPLWWSPDPRTVMTPDRLHVSRSMRRLLRKMPFEVTFNRDFRAVMQRCAQRKGGTWILPEMVTAYHALHVRDLAHSFEVWREGELVGGLYGVRIGALFAGESMFHRETNASKVALICALRSLFSWGVELFDVQLHTPHLESMGAFAIPRGQYLAAARQASRRALDPEKLGDISWQ